MAAVALIKFTQGPNTDIAGRAVKGTTIDGAVTVTNGNNTSVASWQIELLYVPPDSGLVPGILGFADSGVPSAIFPQPDVPGSYRVRLRVSDQLGLAGNVNTDIRNLVVPTTTQSILIPPYQRDPEPLPTLASALPGNKPNEMNVGGQEFGWTGDSNTGRKLLHQVLKLIDGIAGAANLAAVLTVGSFTGGSNIVVTFGDRIEGAADSPLLLFAGLSTVPGSDGQNVEFRATNALGPGNFDGGDVRLNVGDRTGTGQRGKVVLLLAGLQFAEFNTDTFTARYRAFAGLNNEILAGSAPASSPGLDVILSASNASGPGNFVGGNIFLHSGTGVGVGEHGFTGFTALTGLYAKLQPYTTDGTPLGAFTGTIFNFTGNNTDFGDFVLFHPLTSTVGVGRAMIFGGGDAFLGSGADGGGAGTFGGAGDGVGFGGSVLQLAGPGGATGGKGGGFFVAQGIGGFTSGDSGGVIIGYPFFSPVTDGSTDSIFISPGAAATTTATPRSSGGVFISIGYAAAGGVAGSMAQILANDGPEGTRGKINWANLTFGADAIYFETDSFLADRHAEAFFIGGDSTAPSGTIRSYAAFGFKTFVALAVGTVSPVLRVIGQDIDNTGAFATQSTGEVLVRAGDAAVGTADALSLYLRGGRGFGGTDGNIGLHVEPGEVTFASMEKGIFIGDSVTSPTANPVGGGFLYEVTGALTHRGSGGTVTTIAAA